MGEEIDKLNIMFAYKNRNKTWAFNELLRRQNTEMKVRKG